MCCCKPETPHDETMKFVLKVDDNYNKTQDKSIIYRRYLKEKILKLDQIDFNENM